MHVLTRIAPLVLMAVLSAPMAAEPPAVVEIAHDITYSATSVEARQIRQWLQDHTVSIDGAQLGSVHEDGEFRVVHRRTHDPRAIGRSFDPPLPPVPLPGTGAPGEVIELTHTTPGVSVQTWTYEWASNSTGGGWLLIDYSYTRVRLRTPGTGH